MKNTNDSFLPLQIVGTHSRFSFLSFFVLFHKSFSHVNCYVHDISKSSSSDIWVNPLNIHDKSSIEYLGVDLLNCKLFLKPQNLVSRKHRIISIGFRKIIQHEIFQFIKKQIWIHAVKSYQLCSYLWCNFSNDVIIGFYFLFFPVSDDSKVNYRGRHI